MDLLGPFEVRSRGNQGVLMVIHMVTNWAMCIPLADKFADTVVSAYLKDIYCSSGGNRKILCYNESKSKNLLFSEVSTQLGIEHMYSSP